MISHTAPELLVQWESRWHAFSTSIRPALASSQPRLSAECSVGMKPSSSTFGSLVIHIALVVAMVMMPSRLVRPDVYIFNDPYDPDLHVVYYSNPELPQMEDAGGAMAGRSGRSGGRELYNPQVIRIARGNKHVDAVVEVPKLNLPRTKDRVANLLSLPSGPPGPLPVPPQPNVVRDKLPKAPPLNASVMPPPRYVNRSLAANRAPTPLVAVPSDLGYKPKLILPAVRVVEPSPPVARDIKSLSRSGVGNQIQSAVLPPEDAGGPRILSAKEVISHPSSQMTTGSEGGSGGGGGGSGGEGSVIISSHPGNSIGIPINGGSGSLSMSPNGGSEPGLGGSGGGTGIGHGTGPGSGASGTGTGSAKAGLGLGNGAERPGTSLSPGPGGSGSGNGTPGGVKGITISGGKVTLPSFASAAAPNVPSRSATEKRRTPSITVVASARSGGALNAYGLFKGSKVYTIYIDTQLGLVILQYAERGTTDKDFQQDLTPPEPLGSDLPAGMAHTRTLISCVMDRVGQLKNMRVLETSSPEIAARIISAVKGWRFRPVLRSEEPIEVDAVIGFDVDTR